MSILAEMPRYDASKYSGIEWLGDIPSNWSLRRFKFLASITTGECNTEDKQGTGLYPFFVRSQTPEKIDTYSYDGEAILTAGDGAGVGKVYHYINGKFDFHQRVYKFSDFKTVIGRYLYYYLYVNFHYVATLGTAKTTVDSLRLPLIQDFEVCFPESKLVQAQIVNFLDKKIYQIDETITIREKQIELLKERKQLIIQQAVTKGLPAPNGNNVPMKDSGIEWIGEIPKHWEIKRAKYLFNEIDERSINGDEELLSVSHLTGVTPRSEKNVSMVADDYSGSKTCKKNDLVMNIMWAWMGAMGVSDRPGIVSSAYSIFRQTPLGLFNPVFLEWLVTTVGYIEHYNKVSTGLHSSRLRFYSRMFFDMEIGYPSREEQDEIVDYVEGQSQTMDQAVVLQSQQIAKLKEYKTTLINSAVTGKIKVS
jgi:type I restriction enzyme S subunit